MLTAGARSKVTSEARLCSGSRNGTSCGMFKRTQKAPYLGVAESEGTQESRREGALALCPAADLLSLQFCLKSILIPLLGTPVFSRISLYLRVDAESLMLV